MSFPVFMSTLPTRSASGLLTIENQPARPPSA
jgi:hypothetical protein